MRTAALLLLFAFGRAGNTAAELQLTPREQEAFEYLLQTETFALPYINIGGNYPGQYHAVRILGRSRGADAAFKELVRSGTTAGQLYGLIGLYRTDPAAFREVVASFAKSQEIVTILVGCVPESERVAGIVHAGNALVVEPGQTVEVVAKWSPGPWAIDIAHGGYTAMFFGPDGRGEHDFKPR